MSRKQIVYLYYTGTEIYHYARSEVLEQACHRYDTKAVLSTSYS